MLTRFAFDQSTAVELNSVVTEWRSVDNPTSLMRPRGLPRGCQSGPGSTLSHTVDLGAALNLLGNTIKNPRYEMPGDGVPVKHEPANL